MHCKNCGQKLDPGDLFCTACGTKVEVETKAEKEESKKSLPVWLIALILGAVVLLIAGIYIKDRLGKDEPEPKGPEESSKVQEEVVTPEPTPVDDIRLDDNGNVIVEGSAYEEEFLNKDEPAVDDSAESDIFIRQQPFYGIWCCASKDEDEMWEVANDLHFYGYEPWVYVTTDWSNLTDEKWYVVTAGVYETEKEANDMLDSVQYFYEDAYVKYSGEYIGEDVSVAE